MANFRGKLLDYYIEATDTRTNTSKSDIQHVYVTDDGATPQQSSSASFSSDPRNCAPLVVTYSPGTGALQPVNPVYECISFGGTNVASTNVMSLDASSQWVVTNAVPSTATNAVVWFQNSDGSLSDTHAGAKWSATIRDCSAPTGPGTATIVPAAACAPVTVIFWPNAGVLQTATQVYAHVGFNGWGSVLADVAMTKTGTMWTCAVQPPYGASQLDAVFNNGAGTWDNNSGLDWSFAISNCAAPVVPSGIVITNPVSGVQYSNDVLSISIMGTAGSNVSGDLTWTNALAGASGSRPVASAWQITGVPLAEGTNVITVNGLAAVGPVTQAVDNATNAVYASWDNGDNGGTGWGGGWELSATSNSGWFVATTNGSANLNIGAKAWGLWGNSGGLVGAVRPFAHALQTGEVFGFKFENNWIQNGGSVGFGLQNPAGQNLFEFFFVGGEGTFRINDSTNNRTTSVGYTETGIDVAFRVTSPSGYLFSAGATQIAGTLAPQSDLSVGKLRVFCFNAGTDTPYNVYFNEPRIVLASPSPTNTSADMTIVRLPPALFDGIPMTWWNRYGLSAGSGASSNEDGDSANNWEEYVADTNPTNGLSVFTNAIFTAAQSGDVFRIVVPAPTSSNRLYDAWMASTIATQGWTDLNLNVPGAPDGGPVTLTVTNSGGVLFFRTGVKVP